MDERVRAVHLTEHLVTEEDATKEDASQLVEVKDNCCIIK